MAKWLLMAFMVCSELVVRSIAWSGQICKENPCEKEFVSFSGVIDLDAIASSLFAGDPSVYYCETQISAASSCFPKGVPEKFSEAIGQVDEKLGQARFSALLNECYQNSKIPFADPSKVFSHICNGKNLPLDKIQKVADQIQSRATNPQSIQPDDIDALMRGQPIEPQKEKILNRWLNGSLSAIDDMLTRGIHDLRGSHVQHIFLDKMNSDIKRLNSEILSCTSDNASLSFQEHVESDCFSAFQKNYFEFLLNPENVLLLSSESLANKIGLMMSPAELGRQKVNRQILVNQLQSVSSRDILDAKSEVVIQLESARAENQKKLTGDSNFKGHLYLTIKDKIQHIMNKYPFMIFSLLKGHINEASSVCQMVKSNAEINDQNKKARGDVLMLTGGLSLMGLVYGGVRGLATKVIGERILRYVPSSVGLESLVKVAGVGAIGTQGLSTAIAKKDSTNEILYYTGVLGYDDSKELVIHRGLYKEILLEQEAYYFELGKLGLTIPIVGSGMRSFQQLRSARQALNFK